MHSTLLHYTTLHCTTLHCATLHYTPLYFTLLHHCFALLHSTSAKCTAVQSTSSLARGSPVTAPTRGHNSLHCTALYFSPLHCTVLYCIALYQSALHYIALHYTIFHCTARSFLCHSQQPLKSLVRRTSGHGPSGEEV